MIKAGPSPLHSTWAFCETLQALSFPVFQPFHKLV